MSLEIFQIEVGMMLNFSTFFVAADGQCAVVDPAFEVDRLLRAVREKKLTVKAILVTHTHPDHVNGVDELWAATGAKVYVGAREVESLRRQAPRAELAEVAEGDTIAVGGEGVSVLATPGHTVDGRSYLTKGAVATGDTLFIGGVGRTDFPGGDAATLWRSLQKLAALPEETRVFPGHDYGQTPTSTIGWERTTNPYLRCPSAEDFVALRTGRSAPRPTRGPR